MLDSRVAKGAHGKGRSSAVSLAPSLYRGCCLQIAGNLHGSLGFAPTRLNTADAPTREKDLPCPADHSVVDFLPVSQLSRLHALQASRPVAGWLRLCILLVCVRGGEADTGFGFPSMPPCGFPGFPGEFSVGLFDRLGSGLSFAVSAVSVLLGVGLPCAIAVLGVTYLGFCLAFGLPKPLFSGVPRFGLLCALLCCCSLRVSSPQINYSKVWVGLAVPSFSHGMPLNPGNADEQQRARRRAGIVLQADRVVLQSTRSRRDDLLTAFDLWLAENMQVTLHELLSGRYDAEAISDALVCYGKELYTAGKAYGRFSETINGIIARKTGLRRQLASAWDLAFNWVVDEPHEHHTALPLTIMLALSALALLWGWAREASLIMLGWAGVLRAGELFAAFRADLVLPRDAAPGTYHALFKIRQPKTRGRAAKHQAVRIDPSDVVALLSAVFGNLSSAEPLWPLSPATLRKRFSLLQASLGLGLQTKPGGMPFSLASLRPGGATFWH